MKHEDPIQIAIIQHVDHEGPGLILRWAKEQNASYDLYHPADDSLLPDWRKLSEQRSLLIVLGGPMNTTDNLKWLKQERTLINDCLAHGVAVLGICLGAQQLATTLGAAVRPAPYKEVGWAPIERTSSIIPGIPSQLMALHWHEQMFRIPAGAELLFSSQLVKNQGFACEKGKVNVILRSPLISQEIVTSSKARAVGLQFHIEQDRDGVREIVTHNGDYANIDNALNQSSSSILAYDHSHDTYPALCSILNWLIHE